MTLTLEVSPETALRVERAQSQGMNIETLLCLVLEQWPAQDNSPFFGAPCRKVRGRGMGGTAGADRK